MGEALSGRDTRAATLTLDGLLKLLFPDPEAEIPTRILTGHFGLPLRLVGESRNNRSALVPKEFGNTQFSYLLGGRYECFVETPEARTAGAAEREEVVSVPLAELIEQGESEALEFKATARYDLETNSANRELVRGPVKTVAAYLNTDGGTLLIGITDDKSVIGLSNDLSTLKRGDADEFERFLRQALIDAMELNLGPLLRCHSRRSMGLSSAGSM